VKIFKQTKKVLKESFDIACYVGKKVTEQADRSEKAVYKSFKSIKKK